MKSLVHQLDPHVVDAWSLVIIAAAFASGVFLITWQSSALRLDVDGLNVAWIALVSFGMAWHAGWGTGLRIGMGIAFGLLVSLAAFYGSLSLLPVTKLGVGIGLAVAAAGVATVSHVVQRLVSFAAAAVGFGTGLVLARAFPIRATTPFDDLFALMTAAILAVIIGSLGSLMLRAVVIRAAKAAKIQQFAHFIPVLNMTDETPAPAHTASHTPARTPNGGRATKKTKRSGKAARSIRNN